MTVERVEGEPVDDLGRLAALALQAIEDTGADVRVLVMVENDERCMTALGGWESDADAVVAMFAHLAAVMKANGKTLQIVPLRGGPES